MKTKAFVVVAALVLAGCTDSDGARSALEGAGYTKIKTEGYSIFGCGQDDTYHTKFTATGPSGKRVDGVVCEGFFKGSTIRTD